MWRDLAAFDRIENDLAIATAKEDCIRWTRLLEQTARGFWAILQSRSTNEIPVDLFRSKRPDEPREKPLYDPGASATSAKLMMPALAKLQQGDARVRR